jgi:hypothetical protein
LHETPKIKQKKQHQVMLFLSYNYENLKTAGSCVT